MFKQKLIAVAAGLLALAAGLPAQAEVVYEQLPTLGGYRISSANGGVSTVKPGYRTFDNFTLGEDRLISQVGWWGVLRTGGEDFEISIYGSDNGLPGQLLYTSNELATHTNPFEYPNASTREYSAQLGGGGFLATAGTTYWISIFDKAPDANWGWTVSALIPDQTGYSYSYNTQTLTSVGVSEGFRLISVPEPGTVPLLALAAGGLVAARVRRSRRARDAG